MMNLSGGEVVVATVRGGVARFANHSCDPNCVTEKWAVGGETLVGLFASSDIQVGLGLFFYLGAIGSCTPSSPSCFCCCGCRNN